jgi:hypothetical protein
MAMIQSGVTSDLLTVETIHKAARVTTRPPEALGHFHLAVPTGFLTSSSVAANAPLFSMRYAPGTGAVAVITKISVGFAQTVGWTAAAAHEFGVFVARSWTVSDSGGTQVVVTGNTNKARTTMDPTGMTDVRVASTTTFTAGTRTLDTNAMGLTIIPTSQVAVASAVYPFMQEVIFDHNTSDHPIVLQNNEGIVINNITAFPAAGTAKMIFNIEWFEASAY